MLQEVSKPLEKTISEILYPTVAIQTAFLNRRTIKNNIPPQISSAVVFFPKTPFSRQFWEFFIHWYLCRNRYKVCVEFENVIKSAQKKVLVYLLLNILYLFLTISKRSDQNFFYFFFPILKMKRAILCSIIILFEIFFFEKELNSKRGIELPEYQKFL